jgi:hypothetical protein
MSASAIMKMEPGLGSELTREEKRREYLAAMRLYLEHIRRNPDRDPVQAIAQFERVQKIIIELEQELPEHDPIQIAKQILGELRKWMPTWELAQLLYARGVKPPVSIERKLSRVPKLPQIRPEQPEVANLKRLLWQAVNTDELKGFKRKDDPKTVYVGDGSLPFPAGVEVIKPKRVPKKRKRG